MIQLESEVTSEVAMDHTHHVRDEKPGPTETHGHHDHCHQENSHHHGHAAHGAGSLNRTAFMATVHCLTGCTIGEVLGMALGTALGWSNWPTVALAVVLAFIFGYAMTLVPLRRAGMDGAPQWGSRSLRTRSLWQRWKLSITRSSLSSRVR